MNSVFETTQLKAKAVLVTGASSGIGQSIAQRFAEAGANVIGLGRNEDGLGNTAEMIGDAPGTFTALKADIAEAGAMENAVAHTIKLFGSIDVLVNNAGVMFMRQAGDNDRARWSKMLQINLLSPIEGCEAAINHMRQNNISGRIINISSLASRLPGGGIYGASKIALEKYTDELRGSLEETNIRAIQIIPGGFATNLSRDLSSETLASFQEKMGEKLASAPPDEYGRTPYFGIPDDVARAVLFAASQPDNLNISELVVRPARNIDPGEFS